MDCGALNMASSSIGVAAPKFNLHYRSSFCYPYRFQSKLSKVTIVASLSNHSASQEVNSRSVGDAYRRRSNLESLFCYDKPIPEEIIEKPVGVSFAEKVIGNNPRCTNCIAKGAVLCTTCAGSGLYVDSIMESQGIIVKVRCLGCGGTGNIMCSQCGGLGHLGHK